MSPLDRIANVSILKVPAFFLGKFLPFFSSLSVFSIDEHNQFLKVMPLTGSQLTWPGQQGTDDDAWV